MPDILSDLAAALAGSLGIAPARKPQSGAQISVHVRADPWIGLSTSPARASPTDRHLLVATMMLEHLGRTGRRPLMRAIEK